MRLAHVAFIVLAALVPPAGSAVAHAGHADAHEVHLVRTDDSSRPFAFEPQRLTISAGTTVRWVNDEDVYHTVTSTDAQDPKRPNDKFNHVFGGGKGETYEFTFDEAGTYHYYCQPHAGFMSGTIVVEGAGGGAGGADGSSDVPGLGPFAVLALLGALASASRHPRWPGRLVTRKAASKSRLVRR